MTGSAGLRRAGDADALAWDRYVSAHIDGSFFHRYAWKGLFERLYGYAGHFLLVERGASICGVLPLTELRHPLFGHALISVPFCVYGGVLADDDAARQALERGATDLATGLGVDYLELRNIRPVRDDWPRKDQVYVTFRRDLSSDHAVNLLAVPRKQRAMIRKASRSALQVDPDPGLDDFYTVYSESLRNLGTPVLGKRHFQGLLAVFGNDVDLLAVRYRGRAVAAVLSYYDRDQVLPYYGGSVAAARGLAANDLMYWALMCRAVERGCRVFDFGRSKRGTGSFDYKRHWGFEPTPLAYEYQLIRCAQVPDLNPNNPRYRLLVNAWKRLPVAVSRLVGPWLARGLG